MLNLLIVVLISATTDSTSVTSQIANSSRRAEVVALVQKVRRSDYEGDRASLKKYYEELSPFTDDPQLSASVHYWRGFAMWRRALNGFNDKATHDDLKADLNLAIEAFRKAIEREPIRRCQGSPNPARQARQCKEVPRQTSRRRSTCWLSSLVLLYLLLRAMLDSAG